MKIIYFAILSAILLTSCHDKDKCESFEPAKVVETIPELNQFLFNYGTYWVYQNPQTMQLDSQVVVSTNSYNYQETYPSKCDGGTTLIVKGIQVYSYTSYAVSNYFMIGSGWYKCVTDYGADYKSSRLIYAGNQQYGNKETELVEVIPTLTLNGNTFTNVSKVLIHPTTSPSTTPNLSPYNIYMYFADSIGLIKQEEDYGGGNISTWEIKSWHIQ